MTGDFVRDFAQGLTWLVQAYKAGGLVIGLIAGFFFVVAVARYLEEQESWELFLVPFGLAVIAGPVLHFGLPWLVEDKLGPVSIAWYFLVIWFAGFVVGGWLGYRFFREWEPKIVAWKERITWRTDQERDKKTDVRTVRELLPTTPEPFDVMDYYEPGFITMGLDKEGNPVRVPFEVWTSSHIQLAGTTGAGKGVAAQMALTQAVHEGEAVFVLDPKNDEWAPHALHKAAETCEVPYHFIDLRDGQPAQINPLAGASRAELQEMFLAAFSLGEKGGDADFYRLNDRKAARAVAALMAEQANPSFANMYREVAELPEVQAAAGFWGAYEEMAELESINAPGVGVDFAKVIEQGGVVYVVGSMRNSPVIKAQRMLMIRLTQICEKRDRLKKQRSVCVFLDELKYHLSKPAMEIFGAARDKGLHALIAHQSLADLRDVPADLDPDAVVGSVIENTALKIIYKLQDPDTAEWLARRSGTKLVDEEIRKVGRNVAQSEILDDDRTIRQSETFLVDTNMMMNLPKRVAVFFSEELPRFMGTSPVMVEKKAAAVAPVAAAVASAPAFAVIEDEPEPVTEPEGEPESIQQVEEVLFVDGGEDVPDLLLDALKDDSATMQALNDDDEDQEYKRANSPLDLGFDDE
ncbi:molybdopterin-guanine dinucleotide biosynthesis protein MobB [Bacterioplanes sanyensis]|uniref:type IV secretory system conjugative DNA transfer family protein n=1 Tax=Bacterioplanes sanyensis TaxID=1249553 RepID=UPI001671E09E|nr:type IV secretory system conjugative DNA transfer family protein [Bacterioplanes sanyensis]GGY59528.1 molybdopterin-guanine dinucleotide biosynthesis protein MobB [Bacterioplanes sanyensis]